MDIFHGNCLDHMLFMEDNSVDAIVTDPPYGLSFMGKRWDYDVPAVEVWAECLRVLKPGGLLFASFISTYAPIQDYASGLYDFGDMDRLLAGLEDGTAQPGKNFTNSYFCGEKEAEDMMEKAGLCQLVFAGVENILCGKEDLLHKLASQQQEKWLNLAWRLSQDRKLLGMSEHFLYIGRKQ